MFSGSSIRWTSVFSGVSPMYEQNQRGIFAALNATLNAAGLLPELIGVVRGYAACLYSFPPQFIGGELATAMVESAIKSSKAKKALNKRAEEATVARINGPFGYGEATSILSAPTGRLYLYNEIEFAAFDMARGMARTLYWGLLKDVSQRLTVLLCG